MKKNIKPLSIYLMIYVFIIIIYGLFYLYNSCNMHFSICSLDTDKLNTIITTTASVLAPMIAIVGFQSWRSQEAHKKQHEILELILDKTENLNYSWMMSREYNGESIFVAYRMKDVASIAMTESEFSKVEERIGKLFNILNDIDFLLTKFFINSNVDMKEIEESFSDIRAVLNSTLDDFYDFKNKVLYPNSFNLKTEKEMQVICDKLDRYCDEFMGKSYQSQHYVKELVKLFQKVMITIRKMKKDI